MEAVRAHFSEVIESHEDWINAGIFIETKANGTREEKRPELEKLMDACKGGRVDRILVDSIRHFSRNTGDGVEILRAFSELGVSFVFEKEKIDTELIGMDFLVNMMKALSDNEVISRSTYMKQSIRRKFEEGTYKQPIPPYGYRWTDEGLEIVPEQAEVVRLIFAMVLEGKGAGAIRKELNEQEIVSPKGGKWSQSVLRHIISNPVYTGTMVYQKTYVDDQFHQRKNKGEYDQYYIRDHHEAIISQEDYDNAQLSVRQRAKECGRVDEETANRGGRRYCFTGSVHCGACGATMYRRKLKDGDSCWQCHTHVMSPEQCSMKPVGDTDLRNAFVNVLNKLTWAGLHGKDGNFVLRPLEVSLDKKSGEYEALTELKEFLKNWKITDETAAFPEEEFKNLVDHCDVYTNDKVIFCFRCGLHLQESLRQRVVEEEKKVSS